MALVDGPVTMGNKYGHIDGGGYFVVAYGGERQDTQPILKVYTMDFQES